MKVEIPKCERCCCCLPLRRGILTFAYLNLVITAFFGVLQVVLWVDMYPHKKYNDSIIIMYRGVFFDAYIFFSIILHTLDIVLNVILIVGVHKKNSRLMKWYYYYQLTTMLANFLILILTYFDLGQVAYWATMSALSEYAVAFIGFVVQIYLLLLVHNELKKQRYQEGRSCFINQMAEVFIEPSNREYSRSIL